MPDLVLATHAPAPTPLAFRAQADDDCHLIALWLHGKAPATRAAYRRDVGELFARLSSIYEVSPYPLRDVTLGELQAHADALAGGADGRRAVGPASVARKLAAIKSLMTFAHDVGYVTFNPGRALKLPPVRRRLAQRILSEHEVHRVLVAFPGNGVQEVRNRVLMRLAYATGGRVSELARLSWGDLSERDVPGRGACGLVALFGKGSKERSVLVSAETWNEIEAFRAALNERGLAGPDDALFPSRKRRPDTGRPYHLDPSALWRVVRAAVVRAGLKKSASPHWLRHAHISHALDRGAPVHQVRESAGHASLATTTQYSHARPGDSSGLYLTV